jgi:hypothetical protein
VARLAELRNGEQELSKQESALRTRAIRDGDEDAHHQLESLRLMIEFGGRESQDLGAEIQKIDQEVITLQAQRVEAAKEEAWAQFLAESKEAVKEGRQIEKFITSFIGMLEPHARRLDNMTQLARLSGYEAILYRQAPTAAIRSADACRRSSWRMGPTAPDVR